MQTYELLKLFDRRAGFYIHQKYLFQKLVSTAVVIYLKNTFSF